jgi:hypothetical protein
MASPENTKLCDFTSTNNSDFICTPIAPPAPVANFYEIKPALLNLVMKEQFSSASTNDAAAHLNNFVELCEMLKYKDVYESLSLWKLSEGGEEISLTNNATIFPVGIAEGVFTKVQGRMISTDYLIIECVGKEQITLGRSLPKLLGAVIDVGKGNIRFISPPCNSHVFPRVKSKGKKGRRKTPADPNTSSLDIT